MYEGGKHTDENELLGWKRVFSVKDRKVGV